MDRQAAPGEDQVKQEPSSSDPVLHKGTEALSTLPREDPRDQPQNCRLLDASKWGLLAYLGLSWKGSSPAPSQTDSLGIPGGGPGNSGFPKPSTDSRAAELPEPLLSVNQARWGHQFLHRHVSTVL